VIIGEVGFGTTHHPNNTPTEAIAMDNSDSELKNVLQLNFRFKIEDNNTFIIADPRHSVSIAVEVMKTKVKIVAIIGKKEFGTDIKIKDFENDKAFEDAICKFLGDTILSPVCSDIAKKIREGYNELENYRLREKAEEALREEEPVFTIDTGQSVIEVLGTDGFRLSIAGDYKVFGDLAIVTEVTYVHSRIRRMDKPSFEKLIPVMAIAIYKLTPDGYKLIERKVVPIDKNSVEVQIAGRTVLITTKTIPDEGLPTMMDAKTLMRFWSGEIAKPFREIYVALDQKVSRYVVFRNPVERTVFVLYIMVTYFYDGFPAFPHIYLYGPYGSGKTRAGFTYAYASRHGLVVVDPTVASIFRSADAYRPSIYIDESVLDERLIKLLSAGYKKIKVPRIEKTSGDKFILSLFDLHTPICMGYVKPPDEMLYQRTLVITMTIYEDVPEKLDPDVETFKDIREELYLARLTRFGEVIGARDVVLKDLEKEGFKGRYLEIWLPILTMAWLVGKDVYESVKIYAKEEILRRKGELHFEEKVILAAIEKIFTEKNAIGSEIVFTASDLRKYIRQVLIDWDLYDDKTFEKDTRWKEVNIGRILNRMGLVEKDVVGKGANARYVRKVRWSEFVEAAKKFGYTINSIDSKSVGSVGSSAETGGPETISESNLRENKGEESTVQLESNESVSSAKTEPTESYRPLTDQTGSAQPNRICRSVSSAEAEQKETYRLDKEGIDNSTKRDNESVMRTDEKTQSPETQKPLTDLTDLKPIEKKTLTQFILDSIRSTPKRDIDIYKEVVEALDRGVVEATLIDFNKVVEILRGLEKDGVICRYYDDSVDDEVYTLCRR